MRRETGVQPQWALDMPLTGLGAQLSTRAFRRSRLANRLPQTEPPRSPVEKRGVPSLLNRCEALGISRVSSTWGILALLLLGLNGCGAVFPEMKTPVRAPAADTTIEPAPGDDLYLVYFERAVVPNRTRDGRPWDPDPYAKLLVNSKELIVTAVEARQRKPTWPSQKLANYRFTGDEELRIEVWDQEPIADKPICIEKIRSIKLLSRGLTEISCDGGARVWLYVGPAVPVVGVGLYYELRGSDGVRITRVAGQSPASRAGLGPGDRILAVQGESVMKLDALEIMSKINANARQGVELDVWFKSGDRKKITLKEEAIYPLNDDDISIPQTRPL